MYFLDPYIGDVFLLTSQISFAGYSLPLELHCSGMECWDKSVHSLFPIFPQTFLPGYRNTFYIILEIQIPPPLRLGISLFCFLLLGKPFDIAKFFLCLESFLPIINYLLYLLYCSEIPLYCLYFTLQFCIYFPFGCEFQCYFSPGWQSLSWYP